MGITKSLFLSENLFKSKAGSMYECIRVGLERVGGDGCWGGEASLRLLDAPGKSYLCHYSGRFNISPVIQIFPFLCRHCYACKKCS